MSLVEVPLVPLFSSTSARFSSSSAAIQLKCGPERRYTRATTVQRAPRIALPHVLGMVRARSIASHLSTLAERPPFMVPTFFLGFTFFFNDIFF